MPKRKLYVYIAGPYTQGDVAQNVRKAIEEADILMRAVMRTQDVEIVPYVPHLTHFWHLIRPHDYQFWIEYDLMWLHKCDCVLRLPGESKGADGEVEHAAADGIPVFYNPIALLRWADRADRAP